MYKIYKYTNTINGKIYIGQTKNTLEQRALNGTNYKGSRHFYNAIQKYGWNNFVPEILAEGLSLDEANIREEYYISLFKSTDPNIGYNIRIGGQSSDISDETKNILSIKAKERYKDKTKNPMYGKTHSLESLKKMSELKCGKNNPMYGIPMSECSKVKRRKTCIERNIYFSHEWSDDAKRKASVRAKELAKEWSKKVFCIEDNLTFDTITSAADYYGVKKSTLSGHLNGRQHTCKNKHFKFVS